MGARTIQSLNNRRDGAQLKCPSGEVLPFSPTDTKAITNDVSSFPRTVFCQNSFECAVQEKDNYLMSFKEAQSYVLQGGPMLDIIAYGKFSSHSRTSLETSY